MTAMLLWAIFAVITAATVAALIWPFRPRADRASNDRERNLAVYRDQLSELECDTARGLISPADAAAARNEISRRMLVMTAATRDEQSGAGPHGRRAAFLSALISVPLVSVSIYIALGRPNLPDVPRAERLAKAVENNDFVAMVAQVEAHLAENPRDPQGWQVLTNACAGPSSARC